MLRSLPFLCGVGIRMIPRVSVRRKTGCPVSAIPKYVEPGKSESRVTLAYPGHLGLWEFLVPFITTCCC